MATLPLPRMTLRQYLDREQRSEARHEFLDGEIFEMEAATFRHQQIGIQLVGALRPGLNSHGCEIHFSGTRVATSQQGLYTYPDLVIMCGQPKFWDSDPDTLCNPKAIIEILSRGTRDYDRGTKFKLYRSLASLEEYLNVHQDSPCVEHHTRQADGSWVTRDFNGLDAVLHLTSVPIDIPFSVIYAGIEFDAA